MTYSRKTVIAIVNSQRFSHPGDVLEGEHRSQSAADNLEQSVQRNVRSTWHRLFFRQSSNRHPASDFEMVFDRDTFSETLPVDGQVKTGTLSVERSYGQECGLTEVSVLPCAVKLGQGSK